RPRLFGDARLEEAQLEVADPAELHEVVAERVETIGRERLAGSEHPPYLEEGLHAVDELGEREPERPRPRDLQQSRLEDRVGRGDAHALRRVEGFVHTRIERDAPALGLELRCEAHARGELGIRGGTGLEGLSPAEERAAEGAKEEELAQL